PSKLPAPQPDRGGPLGRGGGGARHRSLRRPDHGPAGAPLPGGPGVRSSGRSRQTALGGAEPLAARWTGAGGHRTDGRPSGLGLASPRKPGQEPVPGGGGPSAAVSRSGGVRSGGDRRSGS